MTTRDTPEAAKVDYVRWSSVLEKQLARDQAEIARLREIEEMARLVSQWHGAIESGPIEELDDELHLLYVLTHPAKETP